MIDGPWDYSRRILFQRSGQLWTVIPYKSVFFPLFKSLKCNFWYAECPVCLSHVYFCSAPSLTFSSKATAPPDQKPCHPHNSDTILCINTTKRGLSDTYIHINTYICTYNGWKILQMNFLVDFMSAFCLSCIVSYLKHLIQHHVDFVDTKTNSGLNRS